MTRAQALRSGDPLLALQAHALDGVVAVVPAAAAVFATVSRRLSIEGGVAFFEETADADAELLRSLGAGALGDDAFAPRRLAPPTTTVLALATVEARSPGHAARLHDAGWADRLTMYLRLAGTIVGALSLLRAPGGLRFSLADESRLRRIQPRLEDVYASALRPRMESAHNLLKGSGLTPREADVAELVSQGASNAEIARSLHVSETTVKTHLTRIYTKVGVRTRTQLALLVGKSA